MEIGAGMARRSSALAPLVGAELERRTRAVAKRLWRARGEGQKEGGKSVRKSGLRGLSEMLKSVPKPGSRLSPLPKTEKRQKKGLAKGRKTAFCGVRERAE